MHALFEQLDCFLSPGRGSSCTLIAFRHGPAISVSPPAATANRCSHQQFPCFRHPRSPWVDVQLNYSAWLMCFHAESCRCAEVGWVSSMVFSLSLSVFPSVYNHSAFVRCVQRERERERERRMFGCKPHVSCTVEPQPSILGFFILKYPELGPPGILSSYIEIYKCVQLRFPPFGPSHEGCEVTGVHGQSLGCPTFRFNIRQAQPAKDWEESCWCTGRFKTYVCVCVLALCSTCT